MKNLLVLVFIASILFSCSGNDTKSPVTEKENYEKTKESLGDKEKKDPLLFFRNCLFQLQDF